MSVEYDDLPERDIIPEINDSSNYILVREHSWGITNAYRKNTVLKTIGILNCVGVTLYDPTVKTAGLLHLYWNSYLLGKPEWYRPMMDMETLLHQMEMTSGKISDRSELVAHATLNIHFRQHKLALVTREALSRLGVGKIITLMESNIAIDSKDGRVYRIRDYVSSDLYGEGYKWPVRFKGLLPAKRTSDNRSLGKKSTFNI